MIKRAIQLITALIGTLILIAVWRWWHIRRQRIPAPQALRLVLNPDQTVWLRRDGETLTVQWTQATRRAEIFLVDASQDLNRNHSIATIENQNFVILHGIDMNARYHVEVHLEEGTVLYHIERLLPLKSVPNFRDIGGYHTSDGYVIRWNRVYRSSALDHISVEDSKYIESLGIKLVCDVRTVEEQLAHPDQLPDGMEFISFPPSSDDSIWLTLGRILFQQGFLEGLLLDLYQRVMIEDNPQIFASIFQRLGNEDNLPMVIHCAAGKDRTGVAIALLLAFLGVPDETIIADYSLSNHSYPFFKDSTRKSLAQLQVMGLTETDFDYLLVADATIMQETLDYVRHKYGSVEQYLRSYVGISAETLDAVRRNLLE